MYSDISSKAPYDTNSFTNLRNSITNMVLGVLDLSFVLGYADSMS